MQIDENGWVQWVFGVVLMMLGGAWAYVQRQIGRLRVAMDKQADQINANTQAIAVNLAIREEATRRHQDLVAWLGNLERDIKAGFDKIDSKLEASESTLHTRINDLWKSKGRD